MVFNNIQPVLSFSFLTYEIIHHPCQMFWICLCIIMYSLTMNTMRAHSQISKLFAQFLMLLSEMIIFCFSVKLLSTSALYMSALWTRSNSTFCDLFLFLHDLCLIGLQCRYSTALQANRNTGHTGVAIQHNFKNQASCKCHVMCEV